MATVTTNYTFSGSGTLYLIGMPVLPPTCECGQGYATQRVQFGDGRPPKQVCLPCVDRIRHENAVFHAKGWLEQAFLAVAVAQRPRLYRALAAAFHSDQGGDERLMIALNAVRERFP